MKWAIVFLHVLGNPVMGIASEGEFATRDACERRVEALNRRERGTWYYACREIQ